MLYLSPQITIPLTIVSQTHPIGHSPVATSQWPLNGWPIWSKIWLITDTLCWTRKLCAPGWIQYRIWGFYIYGYYTRCQSMREDGKYVTYFHMDSRVLIFPPKQSTTKRCIHFFRCYFPATQSHYRFTSPSICLFPQATQKYIFQRQKNEQNNAIEW